MTEQDSDQLLKLLEAELRAQKPKTTAGMDRHAFRVWSLIVIVIGAAIALAILHIALSQLQEIRDEQHPAHTSQVVVE